MASKAAMEPGKNLSINKPMEEGKTNSPYNNKDQFKDNEEKKSNANTVIIQIHIHLFYCPSQNISSAFYKSTRCKFLFN